MTDTTTPAVIAATAVAVAASTPYVDVMASAMARRGHTERTIRSVLAGLGLSGIEAADTAAEAMPECRGCGMPMVVPAWRIAWSAGQNQITGTDCPWCGQEVSASQIDWLRDRSM